MSVEVRATRGGARPEWMVVAERRATEDRETLARLLRDGKIRRDYSQNRTMRTTPETVDQFRRDIDGRVSGIRAVKNLAMKPKKRKR